jgi:hypothetical protein
LGARKDQIILYPGKREVKAGMKLSLGANGRIPSADFRAGHEGPRPMLADLEKDYWQNLFMMIHEVKIWMDGEAGTPSESAEGPAGGLRDKSDELMRELDRMSALLGRHLEEINNLLSRS